MLFLDKPRERKHVTRLLPFLALATLLTVSCSDDDESGKIVFPDAVTIDATPTTDQVEVTYNGVAAILGQSSDDFGLALSNRMLRQTTDLTDGVDAVIINKSVRQSGITTAQAAQLIRLFDAGATVVFIEPDQQTWKTLSDMLQKGNAQLESEGYFSDNARHSLQQLALVKAQTTDDSSPTNQNDAVALRDNDMYMVHSLEQQADSCIANTDLLGDSETGEDVDVTDASDYDYDVSDYHWGKSADLLVKWMNEEPESKAFIEKDKYNAAVQLAGMARAASIKDYIDAQQVVVQKSIGPSRAFGRTMPYEFRYFIYGLYDFDKDKEYYLIRQNVIFHGSQLGCPGNTISTWAAPEKGRVITFDDGHKLTVKKNNSDYYFFGPYMRKSRITNTLRGADDKTVALFDPQPVSTTGGSTSYSTGFNMTLGGNFGISKNGPSAGGNFSLTWTESWSHLTPDLIISPKSDGARMAQWLYEGVKPKVNWHWYTTNEHTTVGAFQISDWELDNTMTFCIEHPDKSKAYYLNVDDYTEIAELYYDWNNWEIAVHYTQNHSFQLDTPARFKQEWIMMCSNEALQKNVASQVSLWQNNPTTYAITESLLESDMTNCFNKIKQTVANNASTFAAQGYTGKYHFYVRKQGESTNFAAFTLDNGVVSDGIN